MLCYWFRCLCSCFTRRASRFAFNVGPSRPKKGSHMPLTITIDTTQEIDLTSVPVNDAGQEIPEEKPVSFSLTSGDVQLVPLNDTSVTIRAGAVGQSVIEVSTPDGHPTDVVTVDVTEAEATSFASSVSAPRPKA